MIKVPAELKFIGYVSGLYVCFIYWGYLQEKLTSTKYKDSVTGENIEWDFAYALNLFMAISATALGSIADLLSFNKSKKPIQIFSFAKAAATCAIASPIGYAALNYINFPLLILTKSSKPVPLMLIGVLFYRKNYTWFKYASVVMLCLGCILFSAGKVSVKDNREVTLIQQSWGVFLVGINLFLDGYTNNEQDAIFKRDEVSGAQMMKYINLWQILYLFLYLVFIWLIYGPESELIQASNAFLGSPEIRMDLYFLCLCFIWTDFNIYCNERIWFVSLGHS